MKLARTLFAALVLLIGAQVAPLASAAGLPDLAGGDAARSQKAKERLAKDAICTRCHNETEDRPLLIYQTKHGVRGDDRAPTCQSCHGESTGHATKEQNRPAPDITFNKHESWPMSGEKTRAKTCMTCHEGGLRTHWDGGQHQRNGLACDGCHKVHQARDKVLAKTTQPEVCFTCHKKQRADTHKISTHPIETGKVSCSDCHNPHGGEQRLAKRNNVNETCFNCHAEKRGPFLWQHTSANDNCLNCHSAHGSNIAPLLTNRAPWMCQRCHAEVPNHPGNVYGGAQLPGGTIAGTNPPPQVAFRGCTNCHQAVHGSNHTSGRSLLR